MKQPSIRFVLVEHMLATSLSLPVEMMRAAESSARSKNTNDKKLDIATVSKNKEVIATQAGINLIPDLTYDESTSADLIIVPALWRNPRPIIRKNPELIEWLQRMHQQGSSIIGVSTGCCFLAEAGILDGKPATTHWHYFDQFQRDYPLVELKRQYFITQSGNLYCSGSVNSLADLMVHLIQRIYDRSVASHVERNFSHEIRRTYESASYFEDKHHNHPDEDIVQAQMWLQGNSQKVISLKSVAERFGMSVRTFNRRFKEATSKTPLQYLQELRIDMAKELLQTSNFTISQIADKVGYQDISHFAGLFKKLLGTTPSDYRSTVRAKLFTAAQPASV
jgi:transcriptional regulator GlxA family with amidase domain